MLWTSVHESSEDLSTYPNPQELVDLWETNTKRNLQLRCCAGKLFRLAVSNHVFSAITAYQNNAFNLAVPYWEPERFLGAVCERSLFTVLQVSRLLGRVFTEAESVPGRDDVVLIGWKLRFGGDPGIVGQSRNLNGRQRTMVEHFVTPFTDELTVLRHNDARSVGGAQMNDSSISNC